MKQPMHNRIISFLLALVLFAGYFSAPSHSAATEQQGSGDSDQSQTGNSLQWDYDSMHICRDGGEIATLQLGSHEKIELSAEGVSEYADYQWQVEHPQQDGLWVNIFDGTERTISVTLALVENVLRADGSVKLRCRAYTDDFAYLSNIVTVSLVQETVSLQPQTLQTGESSDTEDSDSTTVPEFVTVTIEYIRYTYKMQSDGTLKLENTGAAFTPYIATLKSGHSLNVTVPCPTIVGFDAYLVDENSENRVTEVVINLENIISNVTYTVRYKPANVNYEVRYFFQNIYDDLYVEDSALVTDELKNSEGNAVSYPVIAQGKTGTHPDVTYTQAIFTGFTSLYYEPETIAADGSTVFHVYYERNYYLMEFDCDGGYGTDTIYVRYGTYVSVPVPVKSGWVFDGWDLVQLDGNSTVSDGTKDELPATMPPYNSAYKALWKAADTSYSVAYWILNGNDSEKIFIGSRTEYANSNTLVSGQDDITAANFCGSQSHTHTAECYHCHLEEHTHKIDQCVTDCDHTHTIDCLGSLGTDGTSNYDWAAIKAIGENEPQVGYIYAINIVGREETWAKIYMGIDSSGNHVWYSANSTMFSGDALSVGKVATDGGTYVATKYVADLTAYNCTHIHGVTCKCSHTEHTHNSDCCQCGYVEHTHHTHSLECYTYTNGGLSIYDENAIKAIGDSEPQSGYVYEISIGTSQRWYKLYWEGKWYTGPSTLITGNQIGETGTIENCGCGSHTHYAKKYAAATNCGLEACASADCSITAHTHTDACIPCGISTHIHTDDCKSEYSKYIVYSNSDSDVTVEGDGSTVVNVYYTYKSLFQIRFIYAKEDNGSFYLASRTNNGSLTGSGGVDWGYSIGSNESVLPTVSDPDGSTERKTVVIDGVTYYYISLTAAFGADIADKWPANNVTSVGGYYWGSWAAAPGSGYRLKYGDEHANIVGPYPTMSADIIVDGGTLLEGSTDTYLAQYMVAWWADSGMGVAQHAYHNYLEVLELPGGSVPDADSFQLESVEYKRYTYTNNDVEEVYIVNISGNENDGKIYRLETVIFSAAHNGDTRVDPVAFAGYTAINDSRNSDNDIQKDSKYFKNTNDSGVDLCSICDDSCGYCNNYIYNLNVHSLKFWNHNDWLQPEGMDELISYGAALQKYGANVGADYMAGQYPAGLEPGAYEFGGWYTSELCLPGTEMDWDTATMPDADMIVYAYWKPVEHDVYFYYDYERYTSALNATEEDKSEYYWYHTDANGNEKPDEYPINVTHGDFLGTTYNSIPKANDGYTFVGWFYIDDTGKKRFAPDTMEVKQELHLFAEWQSGIDTEYTVNYTLEDGTVIAEPTTGHLTAGRTKTFTAKVGTELYADYQNKNLFPTSNSHSILMVEDQSQNTYTFKYVEDEIVYYRVRYLDKITGLELIGDVIKTSTNAIVTEKFVPVEGYVPESYYIRKVLAADGEATTPIEQNEIIFYYIPDETHGPYVIEYYTQVLDGSDVINDASSWTLEQSEIGTWDLDREFSLTIDVDKFTGFGYFKASVTSYDADGTEPKIEETKATEVSGAVTKDGLEIRIYYIRKSYDYTIRYVEYGTNNVLKYIKADGLEVNEYGEENQPKALYESEVSHTAADSIGKDGISYLFYATDEKLKEQTMTIRASADGNVMTFYYQAKTVTINYKAVCHVNGAFDFGIVSLNSESVQSAANIVGSTAIEGSGYEFDGWYSDASCTTKIHENTLWKPNELPESDVTYYALFKPITTSLDIVKEIDWQIGDGDFNGNIDSLSDNFLFRIQGQGKLSYIDLIVCINGSEIRPVTDSNPNKKFSRGSVTINELPVGEYTITELTSWSWEYDVAEGEHLKTITVSVDGSNKVPFKNIYSNKNQETDGVITYATDSGWLEGETSDDNIFKQS